MPRLYVSRLRMSSTISLDFVSRSGIDSRHGETTSRDAGVLGEVGTQGREERRPGESSGYDAGTAQRVGTQGRKRTLGSEASEVASANRRRAI